MASAIKTRTTATRLLTAVAVLSGLVLSAAQAQAATSPLPAEAPRPSPPRCPW
ncbi:hypothetical protein ACFQ0T_09130 [Kitasatospora gansuensis]